MERKPPQTLRKRLDVLAGEWDVEIPVAGGSPIRGRASGTWIADGAFLVIRSEVPGTDFPAATLVIGPDETTGRCAALYHDSRGVARIYEMTIDIGAWLMWRDAAGFCQRFSAGFDDGRTTINGSWEKSTDGSSWTHDFDVTYRKRT